MKIFCLFCVLITANCRGNTFRDDFKDALNSSTIEHVGEGLIQLNLSIKHPRVRVKNFRVRKIWWFLYKSGLFDTDFHFSGSDWIQFYTYERDSKSRVHLAKIDPLDDNKMADFSFSLIPGRKRKPFTCKITKASNCGLVIDLFLRDMNGPVALLATRGYIDFKRLTWLKNGAEIKADFFATDDKYFTARGSIDGVIHKITDYSQYEENGDNFTIDKMPKPKMTLQNYKAVIKEYVKKKRSPKLPEEK